MSKDRKISSFANITDNRFIISGKGYKTETNDYTSYAYSTNDQNRIFVLPRIVCKLKNGQKIDAILNKYKDKVITERINENKVILRCLSNNSNEILQIVSELEYMTELDWCEPEMLFDYKICNPLYSQQYYLRNTGQNGGTQGIDINVEPAWNITNGNPDITVAVIDEGVDRNHEDFGSRVLEGYTIRNENGFGAPQNAGTMPETCKGHGVACAGTIAAANNAIGIRGVAPNIQILPINIVPDPVILDAWGRVLISGFGSNIEIAQAINWAWKRADILSCSWGGAGISNDITLR